MRPFVTIRDLFHDVRSTKLLFSFLGSICCNISYELRHIGYRLILQRTHLVKNKTHKKHQHSKLLLIFK